MNANGDRLRYLEELLAKRGLRPIDLMRELRKGRFPVTRGRFLHELTDEQVEQQIADAERGVKA